MGKNDIYMKEYLSDKERFADLFNTAICQGKNVFKAETMREINGTSGLIFKDRNGTETSVSRHSDILMETKKGEKLMLLAVENQEEIHYAMPVREMLYDALNYMEQVRELTKFNRREKKLKKKGEYLSGLQKNDRLNPVISLVFYYGSKPWDGSKDIHGMLDLKGEELEQMGLFIPNYRMNLCDVNVLAENNSFKSDLQWIIGMLKYRDNKEQLIQYIQEHQEFFREIGESTFGVAKALLGCRTIPVVPAEKKGGIDMCKALDDLYRDGVREGREQGREQGRAQGREQGEARLERLCVLLIEAGKNMELNKVVLDKTYRQTMYQEYGI